MVTKEDVISIIKSLKLNVDDFDVKNFLNKFGNII